MFLESPVSPASFLGAHPTVPQTLQRETKAHWKCKAPVAHKSLGSSWETPELLRAAQGLDASVCAGRAGPATGDKFRLVNNEDLNNKSCRGFTEPMDRMSGQRPSRDHSHLSSDLWSPCCLQQPGTHPLQPELTWAPAGTGLGLMAHTWSSIIQHRVTLVPPVRTGPSAVKCQLPALPKCTEAQKRSPWPVQTDFWKVLSMCMDACGVIKPNSNYSQYKHLSSVQHPWDSTPKVNSISEWLQLFTLQILLE